MKNTFGIPVDTSALIYVAKCDGFRVFARCLPVLHAPATVWTEAVDGGERIGAPEVVRIREAEAVGSVQRVDLERGQAQDARSLARAHRLGQGESEVLALARGHGACVIDEGRGTRVATALGLSAIPTILVPAFGARAGAITKRIALAMVRCLATVSSARGDVVFRIEEALKGR
jgi:predicted nucleic acid-binding protein